jgi:hypothetical protein
MTRRAIYFGCAGAVAFGALWLGLDGPGSTGALHDPAHSATCAAGIFSGGSHYPAGTVATATLDKTTVTFTFTDALSQVQGASIPNPDKTVSHTYELKLVSPDGLEGFDLTGVIAPCQSPPSTSSAPSTTAVTVPSTSTVPIATTTALPSTTVSPTTSSTTGPVRSTGAATTSTPPSAPTVAPTVASGPPTPEGSIPAHEPPVSFTPPAVLPPTRLVK